MIIEADLKSGANRNLKNLMEACGMPKGIPDFTLDLRKLCQSVEVGEKIISKERQIALARILLSRPFTSPLSFLIESNDLMLARQMGLAIFAKNVRDALLNMDHYKGLMPQWISTGHYKQTESPTMLIIEAHDAITEYRRGNIIDYLTINSGRPTIIIYGGTQGMEYCHKKLHQKIKGLISLNHQNIIEI